MLYRPWISCTKNMPRLLISSVTSLALPYCTKIVMYTVQGLHVPSMACSGSDMSHFQALCSLHVSLSQCLLSLSMTKIMNITWPYNIIGVVRRITSCPFAHSTERLNSNFWSASSLSPSIRRCKCRTLSLTIQKHHTNHLPTASCLLLLN